MNRRREPAAGVTLVEMLVALALLALIGIAGFAVLDQVLRVRERTGDRLDRLAERQRAMFLVTLDLATALPASLSSDPVDGRVSFLRLGDDTVRVDYLLDGKTLWRSVSDPRGTAVARHPLLSAVSMAEWRFLDADGVWVDRWPAPGAPSRLGAAPNPGGAELRVRLESGDTLRRMAVLPDGGP